MVIARPRLRPGAVAAVLAAAATLGAPGMAAADGAPAPSKATAPPPAVTTVVLPTGDRVEVIGSGAHASYAQLPVAGASKALLSFDNGAGDHYMIPEEAEPYIGRGLDLRLFDVTKAAAQTGGRVPVTLGFAAGVTPTAPAGVTLTSVGGSTASGYLTAASGPAFAAALRQQIGADVAAGRAPGSSGLPDGLTSVAPATVAPPVVTPFYPLHILQVNALDTTGAAAPDALFILTDTDSARIYTVMAEAINGVARLAVPAGHYSLLSLQANFDPTGDTSTIWVDIMNDFSVAATGSTTVTTDARAATAELGVTTERPATQDGGGLVLMRQSADGGSITFGIGGGGNGSTYVSPAPASQVGKFLMSEQWLGAGPATSPVPYRYALDYTFDHVPSDLNFSSDDAGLATVVHDFSNDPSFGSNMPSFLSGAILAPDTGFTISGGPIPALGPTTVFTSPGAEWIYGLSEPFVITPDQFIPGALYTSDPVSYQPRQFAIRNWLHAPAAPRFGQHPADSVGGCAACIGDAGLVLLQSPIGDSNPDTEGFDPGATTNVTVSWNGQQIASAPYEGVWVQNIPAGPGTIEEVMDVDRTPTGVVQSEKTHTDVVIPWSGTTDPKATLPSATPCFAAATATSTCQILPALTLNYRLNALNDVNTSHGPMENLGLDVGHQSYGTQGSTAAITSAQVSLSLDGGATWKNVPTHGACGHYDALWANPVPGSHLMLRVTATDALGGSINQTITDPYTVG